MQQGENAECCLPKNDLACRTLYALNIFEEKPGPGLYSIAVKVTLTNPDPRIASNIVVTLPAKVMCRVAVTDLEIGTVDADQTTQAKLHK